MNGHQVRRRGRQRFQAVQHRLLATAASLDRRGQIETRSRGPIGRFVARREVFEYLLDHPEFATHVTRTLRVARYRIWRASDGLWIDDGWGTVGRFSLVYARDGTRVMHARGRYKQ